MRQVEAGEKPLALAMAAGWMQPGGFGLGSGGGRRRSSAKADENSPPRYDKGWDKNRVDDLLS